MSPIASPVASVVIPAFNVEAYIGAAIRSVMCQTETDLEIIVVDDCSTDGTVEMVEALAETDRRIRLVRNPVNSGAAFSRNRAIELATGRWICWLDADDEYLPARVTMLIAAGERSGADMVADNLMIKDERSGRFAGCAMPRGTGDAQRFVPAAEFIRNDRPGGLQFCFGYLKPIIRTDFLKSHALRYREDLRVNQDFPLWIDCMLAGARLLLLEEATYIYLIRKGSLSDRPKFDSGRFDLSLTNRQLAERARAAGATTVERALQQRQRWIDRQLAYWQLTDALRNRRPVTATTIMLRHIPYWPIFAGRIARAGSRRLFLVKSCERAGLGQADKIAAQIEN